MATDRAQDHTVVTAVYAPDQAASERIEACLRATDAEFPGAAKVAGIDLAPQPLCRRLAQRGWTVIRPDWGAPPRMAWFVWQAIGSCQTKWFWTVEHDAAIRAGARQTCVEHFEGLDRLASVECRSDAANGRLGLPVASRDFDFRLYEPDPSERLFVRLPYSSLNCVCWRPEALRAIDWAAVPCYPATDRVVSRLVRAAGWDQCVSMEAACTHHNLGVSHGAGIDRNAGRRVNALGGPLS